MTQPTYRQLLLDPRWQKVRLHKLEEKEWACEACMDESTTLSVHHKRYVKGRAPWDYEPHELVVLCQPCHENEHRNKEVRSDLISHMAIEGPASVGEFYAVGAGFLVGQCSTPEFRETASLIADQNPHAYAAGRMLSAIVNVGRMTVPGMWDLLDSLEGPNKSTFGHEFLALLAKHGATYTPRGDL